jgi:Ca2+-binding EF-hand superfamily protein
MILALTAAALPSAASAQQQAQPKPVTRAQYIASIDQAFNNIDTNHDGSISGAELQVEQGKEMERVRAALQAKIRAAFAQLDTNKDGQLSLAEFSAQAAGIKPNQTAEQVLQSLDANHDGKVSAAEFRAPRLPMFDRADLNHDGTVTPDEERRANAKK